MELILVRHAKAEEKRDGLDDRQRHLTEKGVTKFTRLMPQVQKKLESQQYRNLVIWSSPACRAAETAEILADHLDISIDSYHDFIYTGEFEEFEKALSQASDDTTLILVGHEPTWSLWTAQIAHRNIHFKKGGIVCLELTSRQPVEAVIAWQIQP